MVIQPCLVLYLVLLAVSVPQAALASNDFPFLVAALAVRSRPFGRAAAPAPATGDGTGWLRIKIKKHRGAAAPAALAVQRAMARGG